GQCCSSVTVFASSQKQSSCHGAATTLCSPAHSWAARMARGQRQTSTLPLMLKDMSSHSGTAVGASGRQPQPVNLRRTHAPDVGRSGNGIEIALSKRVQVIARPSMAASLKPRRSAELSLIAAYAFSMRTGKEYDRMPDCVLVGMWGSAAGSVRLIEACV